MTRQTLLATAIYLAVVPLVQAVEAFDGNIVLGRPTNTSISVSVMSFSDQEVYVEYGSRPGDYDVATPAANLRANEPHVFELTGLDPDAGYSHRLRFRNQGNGEFLDSAPGDFRTRRAGGSAFSFAVQADSHMRAMTRHQKWCPTCGRELADDVTFANTMINMVKYNPDFLIDLGDTFMTSQNFGNGLFAIQNRQRGAPIRELDVVGDFLLLRQYLGQSAYTVPLFLVLGNHDTERPARGRSDHRQPWAPLARGAQGLGPPKRPNTAVFKQTSPWLAPSRAIRNASHKLVDIEGVEEFYNLSVDPYEHNNLLAGDLPPQDRRHYEELKSGLTALLASE